MENKRFKRRTIRLPEYDYTQDGAYYVTICTWNKQKLFGDIKNGEMVLNDLGIIVRDEWVKTKQIRPYVDLDEFIIMPDHMHGIIELFDVGATRRVAPTTKFSYGPTPNSIGAIVGQFKSIVTKRINKYRKNDRPPIWQRNYFERVIRNEIELDRIRQYIRGNPIIWPNDELIE